MLQNDLEIYDRDAEQWWQTEGSFATLLNITPFRLALISKHLGSLKNKRVLDLGCGGGLISIPLLNSGADLIGVDLSKKSLVIAEQMAGGRGEFIHADVRSLPLPDQSVDYIIAADVLEHVSDYPKVLSEAARVLKNEGKLFISTINRNYLAKLFVVNLLEKIKLIPAGTHDSKLFIKPKELIAAASNYGLRKNKLSGEQVQILKTIKNRKLFLKESRITFIAYSMSFQVCHAE